VPPADRLPRASSQDTKRAAKINGCGMLTTLTMTDGVGVFTLF
jgi:hypothetical protein